VTARPGRRWQGRLSRRLPPCGAVASGWGRFVRVHGFLPALEAVLSGREWPPVQVHGLLSALGASAPWRLSDGAWAFPRR
jgi:hypothetical protein